MYVAHEYKEADSRFVIFEECIVSFMLLTTAST